MPQEKRRIEAYETYPAVYEVITFVADGLTTTASCQKANLSVYTFLKCVREVPELADAYREAQQRGFDAMADALLEPETHPIYGVSDPRKQRILSDNIKWLLSKRQHKRYGDKLSVEVDLTADQAVINALARARERTLEPAEPADLLPEEEAMERILPPALP